MNPVLGWRGFQSTRGEAMSHPELWPPARAPSFPLCPVGCWLHAALRCVARETWQGACETGRALPGVQSCPVNVLYASAPSG